MGLMAGVAWEPAGMIGCHYLGKAFGFRAIGFVATAANECRIQLWRFNRCGIVSMASQCSVACLAGHDHMFALLLLIDHIGMTGLAGIVTCKGNRPSRCLGDRSPAIVPVLAKAAWNNGGT